ncbi:MAG: hypothetical protein WD009_01915 [Phycisphaeraceae bacterium]
MTGPFIDVQVTDGCCTAQGTAAVRLGWAGDESAPAPWARWHWDGRELRARVDPLGFFSLFCFVSDERVMLAASPLTLIARGAPSDLDREALAVFYRLGYFLDDDTPFAHIKVLPADGVLNWRPGRWLVAGGPRVVAAERVSPGDVEAGFIDRFRASVARCVDLAPGRTVLPLTGGRDSRHILLEMHRQGAAPAACVTCNGSPAGIDGETRAAANLARAVGVGHEVIPAAASALEAQWRTLGLTHLCADEHAQMLGLADYTTCHGPTIIEGIGGDILSRNRPREVRLVDARDRDDWRGVAEAYLDGQVRAVGFSLEAWLGPREAERLSPRDAVVDRVARGVEAFSGAAEPLTAFHFWQRTRREIALVPAALLDGAQAVLCPFIDSELVRFLLSLPDDVTRGGGLHDRVIARAYPDWSHLPYHNGRNVTPGGSLRGRVRSAWRGWASVSRDMPRRAGAEALAVARAARSRVHRRMNVYRLHRVRVCAAAAGGEEVFSSGLRSRRPAGDR